MSDMEQVIVEKCYRFCRQCGQGRVGQIVRNPYTAITLGRSVYQFKCGSCPGYGWTLDFGEFCLDFAARYDWFQDLGLGATERKQIWEILKDVGYVYKNPNEQYKLCGFVQRPLIHQKLELLYAYSGISGVTYYLHEVPPNQVMQWIMDTDRGPTEIIVQQVFIGTLPMHL